MSEQDKDSFYQQLDQLDFINAELDNIIHVVQKAGEKMSEERNLKKQDQEKDLADDGTLTASFFTKALW